MSDSEILDKYGKFLKEFRLLDIRKHNN
jgi:hypothetical protein